MIHLGPIFGLWSILDHPRPISRVRARSRVYHYSRRCTKSTARHAQTLSPGSEDLWIQGSATSRFRDLGPLGTRKWTISGPLRKWSRRDHCICVLRTRTEPIMHTERALSSQDACHGPWTLQDPSGGVQKGSKIGSKWVQNGSILDPSGDPPGEVPEGPICRWHPEAGMVPICPMRGP